MTTLILRSKGHVEKRRNMSSRVVIALSTDTVSHMAKALIHIGTPKTGTTAIQKYLSSEAHALADIGFAVPDGWGPNHHVLSILSRPSECWDEPCSFQARRRGFGRRRPSYMDWNSVRAQMREEFLSFVAANSQRTLLFSSESLYSRLDATDVASLCALTEAAALDVQIVVYLREPLSFRISQMGQLIRSGWYLDLPSALAPQVRLTGLPRPAWPGAPNPGREPFEMYGSRLAVWERAFPGRVNVRLYEDATADSGSIVTDYCTVVGNDSPAECDTPDRMNVGLSWPTLQALNEVNKRINRRALTPTGDYNPHRVLPPWTLTPGAAGARFRPPPEAIEVFAEHFAESNEMVRRRYFPHKAALWEPPRIPAGPSRSEQAAVDLGSVDQALTTSLLRQAKRQRWLSRLARLGATSLFANRLGNLKHQLLRR